MKIYTLEIITNKTNPLYMDVKGSVTLDKSKQVAFSEEVKNVLNKDTILSHVKSQIMKYPDTYKVKQNEMELLEIQYKFNEAETTTYTKEYTFHGRKFYKIPNDKQDKIDELEHEIELLNNEVDELNDDIYDLEKERDEIIDKIDEKNKEIEKLEEK